MPDIIRKALEKAREFVQWAADHDVDWHPSVEGSTGSEKLLRELDEALASPAPDVVAEIVAEARREERERLEPQWARMIEAHRQTALSWEKSARELDAALVAATGCEARYDHDNDDEDEIAF